MKMSSENQKIIWDRVVHGDLSHETALTKYVLDWCDQIGLTLLRDSVQVDNGVATYGGFDNLAMFLQIPRLEDIETLDEFWFELAINRHHLRAMVAYWNALDVEGHELPESLQIFRELTGNPNTSGAILDSYVRMFGDSALPDEAFEPESDQKDFFEALALHPNLSEWAMKELHEIFASGSGTDGELNIILDLLRNPSISKEQSLSLLDLYWAGFFGPDYEVEQALKEIIKLIRSMGYEQKIEDLFNESFDKVFERGTSANTPKS